jgi:hypothetical protein
VRDGGEQGAGLCVNALGVAEVAGVLVGDAEGNWVSGLLLRICEESLRHVVVFPHLQKTGLDDPVLLRKLWKFLYQEKDPAVNSMVRPAAL